MLTVSATLLTSCATGAEQPEINIEETELASVYDGNWPLVEHVQLDIFQSMMARAQTMMISACMAEYGFDYDTGQESTDPAPLHGLKYGVESVDVVSEFGYVSPSLIEDAKVTDGTNLTEDEELLLYGSETPNMDDLELGGGQFDPVTLGGMKIPAGGCITWASLQLEDGNTPPGIGARTGEVDLPNRLIWEADDMFKADERIDDINAEWSVCMAENGYDYNSWEEPREGFERDINSSPSELEVKTAIADVNCKQDINMVGRLFAIEAGYQQYLLDENAAELDEYRTWMSDAIRRYEQIISTGGNGRSPLE